MSTEIRSTSPLSRPSSLARRLTRLRPGFAILILCSLLLVAFMLLPLLSLFIRTAQTGGIADYITHPVVLDSLRLSMLTTGVSLALCFVLGTPVGYLLARYSFPGARLIDTLIDLPMVLPPAVAGVAMLMAFGRRGLVGAFLGQWGLEIAFSTAAVIMAQVFVAAPFYIRAARTGFEKVPVGLERVSATLGVSGPLTFWRITVPLALPSLLSGAIMAWARALGEFGATIMFAGSFQGRTQTMPLAIYSAMETDMAAALAISAFLVAISFIVLLAVRLLTPFGSKRGRNA